MTVTLHDRSHPPVHLTSFGHALGEAVDIAAAPWFTDDEREKLLAQGLRTIRRTREPVWSLAATAIEETMRTVPEGHGPQAIVIAGGRFDWDISQGFEGMLMEYPRLAPLPLFGISLNACAGAGNAMTIASALLNTFPGGSVLVVTADLVHTDEDRVHRNGRAVSSDAAASCLVSREPLGDGYRLLGCAQTNRLDLSLPEPPERKGFRLREQLRAITATADAAREAAGAEADDITDFLGNNLAPSVMELQHKACEIPKARLRSEFAPELGHCFSGDIFLALRRLLADPPEDAPARPLAIWGSYTSWTGAVLERVAQPPVSLRQPRKVS
ncbi:3-hydroxy-3-methylglutaryl CoA synthase [Saccharothrix tamanrassetensis]|uniref:3-hydroxy-3-methylglutaryl CoA synthase n=1 Tax=Saccharothrix tamanrassetensis TaxID=1051531 RepID=A0A841CTT9_9PSEU|nr:hypothetical protein [Saccharothrix tamanrassetensis]MBB5960730.1 3-hydroxy-3-methylglutaryl CoA synthase [Saccharothrix tamanrassetensis]